MAIVICSSYKLSSGTQFITFYIVFKSRSNFDSDLVFDNERREHFI